MSKNEPSLTFYLALIQVLDLFISNINAFSFSLENADNLLESIKFLIANKSTKEYKEQIYEFLRNLSENFYGVEAIKQDQEILLILICQLSKSHSDCVTVSCLITITHCLNYTSVNENLYNLALKANLCELLLYKLSKSSEAIVLEIIGCVRAMFLVLCNDKQASQLKKEQIINTIDNKKNPLVCKILATFVISFKHNKEMEIEVLDI